MGRGDREWQELKLRGNRMRSVCFLWGTGSQVQAANGPQGWEDTGFRTGCPTLRDGRNRFHRRKFTVQSVEFIAQDLRVLMGVIE